MNIVQLNFKNYIRAGVSYHWQIDIEKFVTGLGWSEYPDQGPNTHTVIFGDEELYEMASRGIKPFINILGEQWIKNNMFVFKLQKHSSSWRVCGIRSTSAELGCVESFAITENSLHIRATIGRSWHTVLLQKSFDDSQKTHRKSHFQTPAHEILVNDVLQKANESVARYIGLPTSFIVLESKSLSLEVTHNIILIDEYETKFLSCYSIPALRFEMYLKPFQLELWISLCAILTSISVFIYVYNRKNQLSPSFSPFFFFR
jgi:hypothetical protein